MSIPTYFLFAGPMHNKVSDMQVKLALTQVFSDFSLNQSSLKLSNVQMYQFAIILSSKFAKQTNYIIKALLIKKMGVSVSNSQTLRKISESRQQRRAKSQQIIQSQTKIVDIDHDNKSDQPKTRRPINSRNNIENVEQLGDTIMMGEKNGLEIMDSRQVRGAKLKKNKNNSSFIETKNVI